MDVKTAFLNGPLKEEMQTMHGVIMIAKAHLEALRAIVSVDREKQRLYSNVLCEVQLNFTLSDGKTACLIEFTKALQKERFEFLVHKIGMRCMTTTQLERLVKLSS
ncbi:hypothetical protein Tco_1420614 [Tanacetum coccineum]